MVGFVYDAPCVCLWDGGVEVLGSWMCLVLGFLVAGVGLCIWCPLCLARS